jgi:hypothetical protein
MAGQQMWAARGTQARVGEQLACTTLPTWCQRDRIIDEGDQLAGGALACTVELVAARYASRRYHADPFRSIRPGSVGDDDDFGRDFQ